MTHICVSKLTIIGSDNGLSPDRHQAIIWTNAGILLINTFTVSFNKLKFEYDKAFPIVKIKKKYNNRKPWLSPALRDSIKKKNKLHVKMHNRPTLHNTILYKQYRSKLNKILTNAERAHYNELFKKHKDNLQKTWRILKQMINKQKINKINDTFTIKTSFLLLLLKYVNTSMNSLSMLDQHSVRIFPRKIAMHPIS